MIKKYFNTTLFEYPETKTSKFKSFIHRINRASQVPYSASIEDETIAVKTVVSFELFYQNVLIRGEMECLNVQFKKR